MRKYNPPEEIRTGDDLQVLTPEEAARAARALLVKYGWHQGSYRGTDGSFCLAGAIRYVYAFSSNFESKDDLHYRIENLLDRRGEPDPRAHPWNDAPGRTKRQVLELLRSVEKGYGK